MKEGRDLPLSGVELPDGRPVICGIRPEHLSLSDSGIPVEVILVEPTGSETQLVVEMGGDTLTMVLNERTSAKPGDILHVMPTGPVHLFDPATGVRL